MMDNCFVWIRKHWNKRDNALVSVLISVLIFLMNFLNFGKKSDFLVHTLISTNHTNVCNNVVIIILLTTNTINFG